MKYGKFVALGLVALSVAGCGVVEESGDLEEQVSGISEEVRESDDNGSEGSGDSEESGKGSEESDDNESDDNESDDSDDLNSSADNQVTLTQEELANGEIKASKLDTSNIPTQGTAVDNPEVQTKSDKVVAESNNSVTSQLDHYKEVENFSIPLDDDAYKVFNEPTVHVQGTAITSSVAQETSKVSLNDIAGTEKELRTKVVNSALSQLGNTQDCTMLATRSIASIGVNFHGWPKEYKQLGKQVSRSEAKPGDLVIYDTNGQRFQTGQWAGQAQSHIAVYIGDGKAVHGGWSSSDVSRPEAGTTAVWSVDIPGASEPLFYSLNAYNK